MKNLGGFNTVGELIKLLNKIPSNYKIAPFGEDCMLACDDDAKRAYIDCYDFFEEEDDDDEDDE